MKVRLTIANATFRVVQCVKAHAVLTAQACVKRYRIANSGAGVFGGRFESHLDKSEIRDSGCRGCADGKRRAA